MQTTRVIVLPYDSKWKTDFENIRKEIEDAAGDLIIGIEHVGSTSVAGLSAKPCIDIDVVIKDYSVFHVIVSRLETIGYIHEGGLCRSLHGAGASGRQWLCSQWSAYQTRMGAVDGGWLKLF